MTGWKCFFGLHKWSKWSEPTATHAAFFRLGQQVGEPFATTKQDRTCTACGLVEEVLQ